MTGARSVHRPVPRWLLAGLFALVAGLVALDLWVAAMQERPLLRAPTVILVLALVAVPLVPYVSELGVGSMQLAFRKPSRDLQDGLVRSAATLLGERGDEGLVARLRRVEEAPADAVAAAVALVYRSLYALLVAVEAREDCSTAGLSDATEGLPGPTSTDAPAADDVRTALDRVTDADLPEIDRLEGVLDRFLDALLAARESGQVTTDEARELVERGAHLATYVRLYARLYAETEGAPARAGGPGRGGPGCDRRPGSRDRSGSDRGAAPDDPADAPDR